VGASGQAVTYDDASAKKRKKGLDVVVRLVIIERMHPVAILHLWTLTGVDLTHSFIYSLYLSYLILINLKKCLP
jgi:BarA-like signal transduction histidine kinase